MAAGLGFAVPAGLPAVEGWRVEEGRELVTVAGGSNDIQDTLLAKRDNSFRTRDNVEADLRFLCCNADTFLPSWKPDLRNWDI